MKMSVTYSHFCGRIIAEHRNGLATVFASDGNGGIGPVLSKAGPWEARFGFWPFEDAPLVVDGVPTSLWDEESGEIE